MNQKRVDVRRAELVHVAGDQLLPGARLPAQQDRGVARCDLLDSPQQGARLRVFEDERFGSRRSALGAGQREHGHDASSGSN
jgi:hypothetical protein